MSLILVNYDLRHRADYGTLLAELRRTNWLRVLPNTWILSTLEVPEQVISRLLPHIDANDSCLVVRFDPGNYRGQLPPEAAEWLQREPVSTSEAEAPHTYANIVASVNAEVQWKQSQVVPASDRRTAINRALEFTDGFREHISGGSRVSLDENFIKPDVMFSSVSNGIYVNSKGTIWFAVRVEFEFYNVRAKHQVIVSTGVTVDVDPASSPRMYDPVYAGATKWVKLQYSVADNPWHMYVLITEAVAKHLMHPDHVRANNDRLLKFYNSLANHIELEARSQVWKSATTEAPKEP